MDNVERWEADMRRFLDKSSHAVRASTLAGLRATFRKPDPAAAGIYLNEQTRFTPWGKPGGELYAAALDRLEQEFGS